VATARSNILMATAIMQAGQPLVQAEAIACLQQLHMFAPRQLDLGTLVNLDSSRSKSNISADLVLFFRNIRNRPLIEDEGEIILKCKLSVLETCYCKPEEQLRPLFTRNCPNIYFIFKMIRCRSTAGILIHLK
jgi:hypothetical protein